MSQDDWNVSVTEITDPNDAINMMIYGRFRPISLEQSSYQCHLNLCGMFWSANDVKGNPFLVSLACPNCGSPLTELSKETPPIL